MKAARRRATRSRTRCWAARRARATSRRNRRPCRGGCSSIRRSERPRSSPWRSTPATTTRAATPASSSTTSPVRRPPWDRRPSVRYPKSPRYIFNRTPTLAGPSTSSLLKSTSLESVLECPEIRFREDLFSYLACSLRTLHQVALATVTKNTLLKYLYRNIKFEKKDPVTELESRFQKKSQVFSLFSQQRRNKWTTEV